RVVESHLWCRECSTTDPRRRPELPCRHRRSAPGKVGLQRNRFAGLSEAAYCSRFSEFLAVTVERERMRHHKWVVALSLCAASVLAGCGGGQAGSDDEIVIGEFGSLTGTQATFGISTRNGIDLAIEQVNAAGG